MCHRLAERVTSLQFSLVQLGRKLHEARQVNKATLKLQEYCDLCQQLLRVLAAIEQAHNLIQAWGADANETFFSKLKHALNSSQFHEEFVECSQKLSECLADLRNVMMMRMFMQSISLPSSDAWPEENRKDSTDDLQ
eukprot:gene16226-19256_t